MRARWRARCATPRADAMCVRQRQTRLRSAMPRYAPRDYFRHTPRFFIIFYCRYAFIIADAATFDYSMITPCHYRHYFMIFFFFDIAMLMPARC